MNILLQEYDKLKRDGKNLEEDDLKLLRREFNESNAAEEQKRRIIKMDPNTK